MNDLQIVKKACFTGYRPEKFPFKLNNDNADFSLLKSRINKTLTALIEDDCKVFYTGMAQGFDIVCAECVLQLKKNYPDILLVCVLPYENQERSYTVDWRNRYYDILVQTENVIYTSKEYYAWCFQDRNIYMVDNSDFVICWYDGKSGGTRNTIKYAQKQDRYIINLNVEHPEELNKTQSELNFY